MEHKIEELIGKRVLIKGEKGIVERTILEISPSGKYVKVEFPGGTYWRSAFFLSDLIVEVL